MSPRNDWDEAYDQLEAMRLSAERSGAAPEDWAGLPTKADVQSASRRAAQAQRAAALAAYRLSHELPESMSDATVWALLMIEAIGKPSGGATALDSRGGPATRQEPRA